MYTYDIDAQEMFDDRTHQFEKFGIPIGDIENVRTAVTDVWPDAPGGWVYEWSKLAESYADTGGYMLAALTYGCAKFPCLTGAARVRAMDNQLKYFEAAAPDFPVRFERRIISVPYRGGTAEVPVHPYSADGNYAARPVLIASGGLFCDSVQFCSGLVDFVVGVLHHGGGGHRLTLAGERFIGLISEDISEVGDRGVEFGSR